MNSPVKKAQSLRKLHAYYAQTTNGFGTILAGVVYWLIFIVNQVVGPGIPSVLSTVGLIVFWLVGKELIRHTLYLAGNNTREPGLRYSGKDLIRRIIYQVDDSEKEPGLRHLRFCHIVLIFCAVLIALDWGAYAIFIGSVQTSYDLLLLFMSIAALPILTWRCLRLPFDFIAGFFLWVVFMIITTGHSFVFSPHLLYAFPIAGMILILVGLGDDVEFCRITHKMEDFI